MPKDFKAAPDNFDAIVDAIDYMPTPAFILSMANGGAVFLRRNPAYAALFDRQAAAVVAAFSAAAPFEPTDVLHEHAIQCVEGREPQTFEEVVRLPQRDIHLNVTLSPLFDADGAVNHLIGSAFETTTFKAQERETAQTLGALKALNEDLGVFTSIAAHDLRSPLGTFCSVLELVLEDFQDLGDEKLQLLTMCSDMAQSMIHKINSILSYSQAMRLEEAAATPVDLDDLFSDLEALLDPKTEAAFQHSKGVAVAEGVVLETILRNLIDNALKFGDGEILCMIEPDSEQADFLCCTVADNGPGFADGKPRIPTLSDPNRKKAVNGFGLGAVRHLIEARGGKLWIDEPLFATGATVCFTLPGTLQAARGLCCA